MCTIRNIYEHIFGIFGIFQPEFQQKSGNILSVERRASLGHL